jgi:diguanylate cyclase (GGDEF)-like protein
MFLTALGRCSTTPGVEQVAAELVAEEFDAEVGAVVLGHRVGAVVGFGLAPVPVDALVAVRPGTGTVDLPGVGRCHSLAAAWSADGSSRLVVARPEIPFTGADRDLLLGMAGAFGMAADGIQALERERARHRALEVLLAIQRSISHRAPLATILAAVTDGACDLLRGCPVALVLDDDLDPAHPVHVGASLATAAAIFAAPVHVQGIPAGYLRAATADGSPLGEEDRALLSSFAEHASLALTDARTVEAMREAFHDPLTGLPNRPLFEDRLTEALREGPLSVLFVDLDRFKAVNDTLGHAAGDELLLEVADRIRATTRADSSAARFGGDEFAVLIAQDGDPGVADAEAERVIAALDKPFTIRGKVVVVGASVGIAHSGDGRDATQLLADADLAMYRAKASGGGRSATFDPQMRQDLIARLDLEADLRDALARGELSVVYQPIVDLVSGRPTAVEALLRWHSPTRGSVPPSVIVPIAEAIGLIVPIGRGVLQEACACVRGWRRTLPDLRVSVNVSVHQLREPGFAVEVGRLVEQAGLPTDAVILEVTESALITDEDETVETLHALAALGFAVALDDFGTGYSSLSYLQRFPVNMLKIDRSFVSGGLGEKSDRLVRTVIELGRAYGLDVVAEGIEDEAQLRGLVLAGCLLGQGYHLGRPAVSDVAFERLRLLDRGAVGAGEPARG